MVSCFTTYVHLLTNEADIFFSLGPLFLLLNKSSDQQRRALNWSNRHLRVDNREKMPLVYTPWHEEFHHRVVLENDGQWKKGINGLKKCIIFLLPEVAAVTQKCTFFMLGSCMGQLSWVCLTSRAELNIKSLFLKYKANFSFYFEGGCIFTWDENNYESQILLKITKIIFIYKQKLILKFQCIPQK